MQISVIMPTLNEASNVSARAAEIQAQLGPLEWIVCDGGSVDGTVEIARALGAVVVCGQRGRARQMIGGANASTGDTLLFLHADTALPLGAFDAIRHALADPAIVGGNFTLQFDKRDATARFLELVYAGRQRFLRSYFGDSAMFVRRPIYDRIGGFRDMPIMEDYAFARSLQKSGKTKRLALNVVTSSRRYSSRPLATIWNWITIMTLYRLGVSPMRLAHLYGAHGHRQQPPAS